MQTTASEASEHRGTAEQELAEIVTCEHELPQ